MIETLVSGIPEYPWKIERSLVPTENTYRCQPRKALYDRTGHTTSNISTGIPPIML